MTNVLDAAGTYVLKREPGTLHRIIMTRSGGGASTETIAFHDGTSAADPIISVIAMSSNDNRSHTFGHVFNDGLTIVVSSSQFDITLVID